LRLVVFAELLFSNNCEQRGIYADFTAKVSVSTLFVTFVAGKTRIW
jgi:hypothetical protein